MGLVPEGISNFIPHHPLVDIHLERLDPGQIGRLREGCMFLGVIQPLFQVVEQIVKSGIEGVGQSLKNCTLAVQVDSMCFPP